MRASNILGVTLLLLSGAAMAAGPEDSSVVTTIGEAKIEITVPASRLLLTLPKGGFGPVDAALSGSQNNPRYFHLADLDKGLVIDAYVRVSLIGIELITIDARIVIASVDTYLRFAEAVNRLDISEDGGAGLPELMEGMTEGGAKSR